MNVSTLMNSSRKYDVMSLKINNLHAWILSIYWCENLLRVQRLLLTKRIYKQEKYYISSLPREQQQQHEKVSSKADVWMWGIEAKVYLHFSSLLGEVKSYSIGISSFFSLLEQHTQRFGGINTWKRKSIVQVKHFTNITHEMRENLIK